MSGHWLELQEIIYSCEHCRIETPLSDIGRSISSAEARCVIDRVSYMLVSQEVNGVEVVARTRLWFVKRKRRKHGFCDGFFSKVRVTNQYLHAIRELAITRHDKGIHLVKICSLSTNSRRLQLWQKPGAPFCSRESTEIGHREGKPSARNGLSTEARAMISQTGRYGEAADIPLPRMFLSPSGLTSLKRSVDASSSPDKTRRCEVTSSGEGQRSLRLTFRKQLTGDFDFHIRHFQALSATSQTDVFQIQTFGMHRRSHGADPQIGSTASELPSR